MSTEHLFELRATIATPLRLSSGDASASTDAPARRSANGELVIPGTSLAGALRSAAEQVVGVACKLSEDKPGEPCGCEVCVLFGDAVPKDNAAVSKLTIHDAAIVDGRTRVVDGVGLDRERRTAADGRKYDAEVVTVGTVVLRILGRDLTQDHVNVVAYLLDRVGGGAIPLGGRVAAGFGVLAATEGGKSLRMRDLAKADHVLAALTNDGDAAWKEKPEWPKWPEERAARGAIRSWAITVRPTTNGTWLVADPAEAVRTGFKKAPRGGAAAAELPGTSLRGVLRAQAERILRTLRADGACDPAKGCAAKATQAEKAAGADRTRALQAGRAEDAKRCLACRVFGNERVASPLRIAVKQEDGGGSRGQPFDHVAIDRFTGGAAMDGRKFDALAARGGVYGVTITFDGPRAPDGDLPWMRALIALALRDLHEGRVQVGGGAAKGHGTFEVDGWKAVATGADVAQLWTKLELTQPKQGGTP